MTYKVIELPLRNGLNPSTMKVRVFANKPYRLGIHVEVAPGMLSKVYLDKDSQEFKDLKELINSIDS